MKGVNTLTKLIIGIDGGGTKTKAAIGDLDGNVLGTQTDSSSNYHLVGEEQTEEVFRNLIDGLLNKQGATKDDVTAVCLGLSGVDRPDDREVMSRILNNLDIEDKTVLVNDAVIALMGGALSDHGIIVISGTGSISYGISRQGEVDRVGGWGHVLDDEGSGYKIGHDGLRAIMRAHDGRRELTKISKIILDSLGMQKPEQLVAWSAREGLKKPVVARLAAHVFEAFRLDDKAAQQIVEHHADELALGVRILVKRMQMPPSVIVVLCGGVFDANPEYFSVVRSKITERTIVGDVIGPKMPPVVGALLCALRRKVGMEMNRSILHQLRETFFTVNSTE